jgi:hypothetical protein
MMPSYATHLNAVIYTPPDYFVEGELDRNGGDNVPDFER